MKVVINVCFGGFGLSEAAMARYAELTGSAPPSQYSVPRDDPALVQTVEELGAAANGVFARLRVVDIPEGVEWEIAEYDGNEHVAEQHRTWS